MSNYYTLRTQPLLAKPVGNPDVGTAERAYGNIFVADRIFVSNVELTSTTLSIPKITQINYISGNTASTAGAQTLSVTGSGFASGAQVLIDNRPVDLTTYVSSTVLQFLTPAKTAGTYSFFVINADGITAASAVGITYS